MMDFIQKLWAYVHSNGNEGYLSQSRWLAPIAIIVAGFQELLLPDSFAYFLLGFIANIILIIIIYLLGCWLVNYYFDRD